MKNIEKSYFIIFGLIVLAVVCFSTSYAIFSNTKEEHGKLNIVAGNLNYKIESSELDSDSVTVPANTSKEIRIKLTSLNEVSSKYELYYILDKTNDKVSVGYSKDTKDSVLGTVEANKSKMITIVIRNDSDTSSKVTFKVLGGLLNNDLALKEGNSLNQEVVLCSYEKGYEWNFDYTGGEQEFTTPCSGTYKLETWGAQGGASLKEGSYGVRGGFGGYSMGTISLIHEDNLYINVGGMGENGKINKNNINGGYNGGGVGHWDKNDDEASGGGGGATHIAAVSGILSSLSSNASSILIVSGAGGGSSWTNIGGTGGGISGTSGTEKNGYTTKLGTQTTGNAFGLGGNGSYNIGSPGSGGGGGLYGGAGGYISSSTDMTHDALAGAGGSGYIGNSRLTNKVMYCYNCTESSEESTKTTSTTCTNKTPTENCSKQGNGYARITYLGN